MHPIDGCFLKLRRAKYHFQVVNDLIKGMHKRSPYQIIPEIVGDGYTREHILRFKQLEGIPPDVSLLIGDICNNLRSALDHLLWQLWLLKDSTFNGEVYFPICDSPGRFISKNIAKNIEGLSNVQWTAIERLQPYKTGKIALSILRDINKSDKHRLIQVVRLIGDVRKIRIYIDQSKSLLRLPLQPNIPLQIVSGSKIEHDTILAQISLNRYSSGTQVRVQSKAVVNYAFEGSGKANGQLVEPSLASMISEVSHAITLLEPEFAHLGTSAFKEEEAREE
jgi:hypothetical protein